MTDSRRLAFFVGMFMNLSFVLDHEKATCVLVPRLCLGTLSHERLSLIH
jgi:hypothetical protein